MPETAFTCTAQFFIPKCPTEKIYNFNVYPFSIIIFFPSVHLVKLNTGLGIADHKNHQKPQTTKKKHKQPPRTIKNRHEPPRTSKNNQEPPRTTKNHQKTPRTKKNP